MIGNLLQIASICLITLVMLAIGAYSIPECGLKPVYWPISGWFLACFIRFGISVLPFLLGSVLAALWLFIPHLNSSYLLLTIFYYYVASIVIRAIYDSSITSKNIIFYSLIATCVGFGSSIIQMVVQKTTHGLSSISSLSFQMSISELASITTVTPIALLLLYHDRIIFDRIQLRHVIVLLVEILIVLFQTSVINSNIINVSYTIPLLIPITLWGCLTLSFSLVCCLVFFSALITSAGVFFFAAPYALSSDCVFFIQLQTCVRSFSLLAFAALRHERDLESRKLHLVQNATLVSLANLAETRDNDTGTHIKRTQNYVRLLTSYLSTQTNLKYQLSPKTVERICRSAPLHDIGKVGIPDSILLKPGSLTPKEFEIMKGHTEIGKRTLEEAQGMLGQESFLETAQIMAFTHHERWDGKGYPQGLRGEEIPIAGRIMALADVYDALTSPRVYKSALSFSEASKIILSERGKQFDPIIVDAFEALAPEFCRVQEMGGTLLSMPVRGDLCLSNVSVNGL